MNEKDTLESSIRALYHVFAKYPLRRDMPYCSCCTFESDITKLYQQPLGQLSFDNIERYLWKAMTTWGDVSNFKHYLPRILELLATLGNGFGDVYIVGSKLEFACLKEWPENERLAVNEFFRVWWRYELSIQPEGYVYEHIDNRIEECLGCIALSIKDIREYFEFWQKNDSISAIRHLSHFLFLNYGSLMSDKEKDIGWYDLINDSEFIKFLLDDRTLVKLETAFWTYSDTEFAFEFSEAEKYLQFIRSSKIKSNSLL